jgi:hypothetical protein
MSVVSGIMGANAQSDAANTAANSASQTNSSQERIANQALGQQKDLYNQDIARNKPFYDQGVNALGNLNKMVNGGYDMKESPAAQYVLTQGTKGLNRQLAARGLLGSGNAAQRLGELSSGVAASDYSNQYSRLLDQIKIGTGASAAAGASSGTMSGAIGQNASALSGALGTNGLAQQNAAYANGNARASLYGGIGQTGVNAVNTGINAYRSGMYNSGGGGNWASDGSAVGAVSGQGNSFGVLTSDGL